VVLQGFRKAEELNLFLQQHKPNIFHCKAEIPGLCSPVTNRSCICKTTQQRSASSIEILCHSQTQWKGSQLQI